MTASLEAPPRLSVVRTTPKLTPDPELTQMITSAKAMSERALSLQIDAGRILGEAQALNLKQYAAEMVNSGLDKTQGNKLIAAAAAADGMPSPDVAAKLSPHLLIQLRQKRNQAALDAITDDDTQLSVVEKIKKYRTPSAPKEKKSVRRVGNQKGGTPKLVIEVPPGPHVEEIYNDYEKSGTHVAQWLGSLVHREHDSSRRSPEPNSEIAVTTATPDPQRDASLPRPDSQNETEQTLAIAALDSPENQPPKTEVVRLPLALRSAQSPENQPPKTEVTRLPLALRSAQSPEDSSPNALVPPSLELALEFQAQLDTELPSPVVENPTEQEVAQAELDAYVEAQAQEVVPFVQNVVPLLSSSITRERAALPEVEDELDLMDEPPSATVTDDMQGINVSSAEETSPSLLSPAPSTDRYKQGWHVGDQVVANAVVPGFQVWCQDKPVTIDSVQGNVGEIQTLFVIRHSGAKNMGFGNWVEEVPASRVAHCDSTPPEAAQKIFFQVGETGNDWEGEIVQLVTAGPVYHEVRRLNNDTWTQIQHKFLQEIYEEEGVAVQTALNEEIATCYGLLLGDVVQWDVKGISLTGTIVRLTKLGAFIDEGVPGHAWIKYPQLKRIESESAPRKKLDEILKITKEWSDIEKEVGRDRLVLAALLHGSSRDAILAMREHLIEHLERDQKALRLHDIDWVPFCLLEKVFENLSFEIKDISEGLAPNWIDGCAFRSVTELGKDDYEVWEFVTPLNKTIHAWDRADIKITAF